MYAVGADEETDVTCEVIFPAVERQKCARLSIRRNLSAICNMSPGKPHYFIIILCNAFAIAVNLNMYKASPEDTQLMKTVCHSGAGGNTVLLSGTILKDFLIYAGYQLLLKQYFVRNQMASALLGTDGATLIELTSIILAQVGRIRRFAIQLNINDVQNLRNICVGGSLNTVSRRIIRLRIGQIKLLRRRRTAPYMTLPAHHRKQ